MKKTATLVLLLISGITISNAQVFTEVTSGPLVSDSAFTYGASWIDYNDDGDLDLYVANAVNNNNNLLYQNNGNGTFTQVTSSLIANDGSSAQAASWADYDNDGRMDLFLTLSGNNHLYHNDGNGVFTKIVTGSIVTDGGSSAGCSWGDYDNDGNIDLFVANTNNENNFLYKNDGNGSFTKITSGNIVTDGGNSRIGIWGDYDKDGLLDLFVTNVGQANFLYKNNGAGSFTKISIGDIVTDIKNSHGASWGDFNNDGYLDLYVANGTSNNPANNDLFQNNGNGTFSKVTAGTIVSDGGISVGASWGDYDNDGDQDIYVVNTSSYASSGEANFLYQNDGNGTFTRILSEVATTAVKNSRCGIWGDYDNDGDIDLFVTNESYQNNNFYNNNGNTNKWINIKCVGTVSNHASVGAKVNVKATINGNPIWQYQEISSFSSYLGQNSINAEFGLGNASIIDSIIVKWPSGITCNYVNVPVNGFIYLHESCTLTSINDINSDLSKDILHSIYPNPFSEETTIKYTVKQRATVKLSIYDLLGREVATLVDKMQEEGKYEVKLNNTHLSVGNFYICHLRVGEKSAKQTIVLIK